MVQVDVLLMAGSFLLCKSVIGERQLLFVVNLCAAAYYLCHCLASGEGIISLGIRRTVMLCVCVRRISLDGEGFQCSLVLYCLSVV